MNASIRLLSLLLFPSLMFGDSVATPTPMRIEPASTAPVVLTLSPGDSLSIVDGNDLPAGMFPLPDGWAAIRHEADYQGYVNNNEVMKDFTVEIGAGVLLEASLQSPLLTAVEMDDVTGVSDVVGEWSRVTIRKSLVGYIDAATLTASKAPVAQAPVAAAASPALPPPPMVSPGTNDAAAPIVMNGRLERTRRIFGRGPDQDYQLIGKEGKVIAYLETDSLILTEPVEGFLGLVVNVFGVPRKPADSKALILRVESLRLAQP